MAPDNVNVVTAILNATPRDYVQLFILSGFAWFLLRSRAIRALQQSMKEQGRRIETLGREVSRLRGLMERFGCADAIDCKNHRPFSSSDLLTDFGGGDDDSRI